MKKRVLYQQLKLKKACLSTCKTFLFAPSIHVFGRDQTTSRPLNVEVCLTSPALAYIWSVTVTGKELFATKKLADEPEEIERKISIRLPIAITKLCRERIRVKPLSLLLPSLAT
jgi:hypothetical protein